MDEEKISEYLNDPRTKLFNSRLKREIESLDDLVPGDIVAIKNNNYHIFDGFSKINKFGEEHDSLKFYSSSYCGQIVVTNALKRYIFGKGQLSFSYGYFTSEEINPSNEDYKRMEEDLKSVGLIK